MQQGFHRLTHLMSSSSFLRKSASISLLLVSISSIGVGLYYSFDVPGNLRKDADTQGANLFEPGGPLSEAARMRISDKLIEELVAPSEQLSSQNLSQNQSLNNGAENSKIQLLSVEEKLMQAVNNARGDVNDPYENLESEITELTQDEKENAKAALMAQIERMEHEELKRQGKPVPFSNTANTLDNRTSQRSNEQEESDIKKNFDPPFEIEDRVQSAPTHRVPDAVSVIDAPSYSNNNNYSHSYPKTNSRTGYGVDKQTINDIMNHNLKPIKPIYIPKITDAKSNQNKPSVKSSNNPSKSAQNNNVSSVQNANAKKKEAKQSAIPVLNHLGGKKVSLMPVERRQNEMLETTGVFVPRQEMDIFAPASGQVKKVLAKSGDYVRKDQVIIMLETAGEEAEVNLAQAEFNHMQKLVEKLAAQNLKNPKMKDKYDEASLMLGEKKAALDLAMANVAKKEVKAPFNGFLGQWQVQSGGYVREGSSLNRLINKNDLQVEYMLPQDYIKIVKPGDRIEINMEDKSLLGIVRYVSSTLESNAKFKVRAQVDRGYDQLIPGMRVSVSHPIEEGKSRILIPKEAIISNHGQNFVYRWINNEPHLVPVVLNENPNTRNSKVEVYSGLNGYDTIVVFQSG